jgi:uncharacterized protein (TIGR02145 family)
LIFHFNHLSSNKYNSRRISSYIFTKINKLGMKNVYHTLIILLYFLNVHAQTTYTFNGKGNWSIELNWINNAIPPALLPAGSTINISPAPGDTCILNKGQTISAGAFLNISAGAQFIILGNLNVIGYTYPKVSICQQYWMSKNLDVTTYRNGDVIPEISDSAQWTNYTGGAWCWYNNDSASYAALYGKLYNWYAVNDPRGLAPAGWHLPTFSDWAFVIFCYGDTTAGGRLKDTILWKAPNTGATNYSGFAARPGGARNLGNIPQGFSYIGEAGFWWSSTLNDTLQLGTYFDALYFSPKLFYNYAQPNTGLSVRLVKDADPTAPTLSTNTVASFTSTSAIAGGNITKDGGAPVTSRGVCWSTNINPTTTNSKTIDGSGTGTFISNITGLLPNTRYYARAYATNNIGTAYGNQISFVTVEIPIVFTDTVSAITFNAAISGGIINGLSVSASGLVWDTLPNPTIALSTKTNNNIITDTFRNNITGLLSEKTYYVRAYASNISGTGYGNQRSFTTSKLYISNDSSFTDPRDGQVYTYRHIGTQVWMTKNLNYVGNTSSVCYDRNAANCTIYGHLYSWNKALIAAPPGWHLPSDTEWDILVSNLGGELLAGGKMKEAGTAHWLSPNKGADNSSGFAGLPGGRLVNYNYVFDSLGADSYWWSSTEADINYANLRSLSHNNATASKYSAYKIDYISIRCIRN